MDFDIKLEGVNKALAMFDPNNVREAVYRAINEAAAQSMTEAKREITSEYNIKYSRLSQYLRLTGRATKGKPEAEITGRGRGLALSYFDAKQEGQSVRTLGIGKEKFKSVIRKTGRRYGGKVTVLVRKIGGRKEVVTDPRSFIAQTKSGHIAVFQRIGKARLPLKELFGPGVAGLFGNKKIFDNMNRIITEKFKSRFNYWIDRYQTGNK
jgi:hypothetical protein